MESPLINKEKFIYYFAWAWSLFGITYISVITFCPIPKENVRFADTCLGFILGTVIATMLTYFFGSSSGSKSKEDLLKVNQQSKDEQVQL